MPLPKTKRVSLNDTLFSGPDLLQSLPGVLMKFQQGSVAVTNRHQGYVPMYDYTWRRQRYAALRLERPPLQCVPPTEYRMKSVIFNATSYPCTAVWCCRVAVLNWNACAACHGPYLYPSGFPPTHTQASVRSKQSLFRQHQMLIYLIQKTLNSYKIRIGF